MTQLHSKNGDDTVTLASELTGFISGLQNRLFGFDSRRSLQILRYWATNPSRLLPKRGRLARLIFGGQEQLEAIAKDLEAAAYNKAYAAPRDPVHLARQAIWHYKGMTERQKAEIISLRKEISALKRAKP